MKKRAYMVMGLKLKLKIEIDKKYFKSDSLLNGRLVGKFFRELSNNVFKQSSKYFEWAEKYEDGGEIPLLFGERNLYSVFAVAIDKITPVHLSEWSLNKTDFEGLENGRRVDFWCLHRNGADGKVINYFIEIKKGHYCLNENTMEEFAASVLKQAKSLTVQTKTLKRIAPSWNESENVYLGIFVIHGYYRGGKEHYTEKHVRENIYKALDKRSKPHLILSTWILPERMSKQWDKDQCRFISIAGIVIGEKPNS
ncbi:MAG: hypothetical protein Q7U82_00840 [Gammaproteobacteria bacterium]|nr:hypothetical protein [Gammaproteobacteria bacterium]